jgi:hypothetical protein
MCPRIEREPSGSAAGRARMRKDMITEVTKRRVKPLRV